MGKEAVTVSGGAEGKANATSIRGVEEVVGAGMGTVGTRVSDGEALVTAPASILTDEESLQAEGADSRSDAGRGRSWLKLLAQGTILLVVGSASRMLVAAIARGHSFNIWASLAVLALCAACGVMLSDSGRSRTREVLRTISQGRPH